MAVVLISQAALIYQRLLTLCTDSIQSRKPATHIYQTFRLTDVANSSKMISGIVNGGNEGE